MTVGTARRPSREINVRGVGGGVPCARSKRTGIRSSVAIVKAADRRTVTYVRTGRFCRNICASPDMLLRPLRSVYRNALAAFLTVYRNALAAFLTVYRNALAAFLPGSTLR